MFGIVICFKNLVNSCEMWKQIEKKMVIDHFIVKIQVILNSSSNIDQAPAVTEPLRLLWHICSFQVSQSKRLLSTTTQYTALKPISDDLKQRLPFDHS